MAHYSGAVTIPITSYDTWRSSVLGNSYDLDGSYGAQCWDLTAELWYNVGGYSYPYLSTGGTGNAYGCWTVVSARTQNAGTKFDLVTSASSIKRGDVIVMNATSSVPSGHICFADEDYNGTNYISCLGQNQGGGTSLSAGGTTASINTLGLGDFLGCFRLKSWNEGSTSGGDTTSTIFTTRESRFPWVLYANKLRNKW